MINTYFMKKYSMAEFPENSILQSHDIFLKGRES